MNFYWILLFVSLAGAIGWIVNRVQKANSDEPLEDVIDSRLCFSHAWEECLLLSPNETEAWKKEPSAFLKHPKTTYCGKCGFVPIKSKMVRRKLLESLRTAQQARRQNERDVKDVEELKESWFKNYVEYYQINEKDVEQFRKGYDAYDLFVQHLPELVKEKKLTRLMKELSEFKMRA